MKNKVAIIGYGYVGKAMHKIFRDALIHEKRWYDENGELDLAAMAYDSKPIFSDLPQINPATMGQINDECALAIICVPTPMQETQDEFKKVDTSIVEDVIKNLFTPLILIKSTVPPGTVNRLNASQSTDRICFSPEYVGEGKYQITPWKYMSPTDPRTHEFVIIGGPKGTRDLVANFFVNQLGPEKIYYLIDALEAEIIKYMENSWGAMKVIFANEFYQLCKKLGASYHTVREGWALDNRVERMHTSVFVDAQGFDGKCYPKDLNGIVVAGDEAGTEMSLIKAVLRKNKAINEE